ncbi:hypothetical protein [Bradyrhizobium sp. 2S1]|uniref:hypothetical protein n=1 Tax=Bradyrhizobium sp. 2S1 TaxID=1404429 RepID=UPI001588ACD8|nr:hypothetical protein [Bradyrhizobium sp. 2S1]MCK7667864.1 hypothetical protein [Bradyrhizobium sp. 2S1]
MSGTYYADDLGSAVHYALETTHAIAVCPFHLDQTIRIGDDAAERHAFARARKLVRRDGTTWQGDALRKEFGCQLGKAADRYCPRCVLKDDPGQGHGLFGSNPPGPASGYGYEYAMPGPHDEPQLACEGCRDLVTLEKAKLREQPAAIVNS